MNKRDLVLQVLETDKPQDFIPAGFFLHFDPQFQRGQAAVDKHLEFFRYTDMDFVKIQYELHFPPLPEINTPADWAKIPLYKEDFFEPQLQVVGGLVKAAKAEALVLQTLYSPFMLAGQALGGEKAAAHMRQDPEAVKKGMQIITDSLLNFVKAGVRLGLDGFYTSTQGGEAQRFGDSPIFQDCIKPYDLQVMGYISEHCLFNILHVCDYALPYAALDHFLDYPGHVVNTSLHLENGSLTGEAVARLFKRPFMGGLDRLGILASGTPRQAQTAALEALQAAPSHTILGADCTVPGDTAWDNLRAAIQTAHTFERS
jgi:uroporphyrinogen decarboxylase